LIEIVAGAVTVGEGNGAIYFSDLSQAIQHSLHLRTQPLLYYGVFKTVKSNVL
jgi:hypothetical protein